MGEKTIYKRLNDYFMERYGKYEMTAEWYPYPDDLNIWKFDIKEESITVTLTLDIETGRITEKIVPLIPRK